MAEKTLSAENKQALGEGQLKQVSGGARPKYVSSFFCEKCGKTIHLNGVYTLERAVKEHEQKVHGNRK